MSNEFAKKNFMNLRCRVYDGFPLQKNTAERLRMVNIYTQVYMYVFKRWRVSHSEQKVRFPQVQLNDVTSFSGSLFLSEPIACINTSSTKHTEGL